MNGGRGIVDAFRHGNVDLPTYAAGLKTLPLQSRYGRSLYVEPPLGWMMSPVWLGTTSRITFMPEAVRARGEVGEVLVRAEMRVDAREVDAPVPVVAGRVAL